MYVLFVPVHITNLSICTQSDLLSSFEASTPNASRSYPTLHLNNLMKLHNRIILLTDIKIACPPNLVLPSQIRV